MQKHNTHRSNIDTFTIDIGSLHSIVIHGKDGWKHNQSAIDL